MKSNFFEPTNRLEQCPKCGKSSLVKRNSDLYECLWCGFYRDLSQPQGGWILFMATLLVSILLISLAIEMHWQTHQLNTPNPVNEVGG